MNPPPIVVVLVLNWNGYDDTLACVRSLQRSTYAATRVLVIDNASADGSGARLQGALPEVDHLQTGANLGYAGGNNRGIAWALEQGADYVFVLNNDTVVDAECIARLVEASQRERAALVAPKITYFEAPNRTWYAGGDFSPTRAMGMHRGEGAMDHPGETGGPITFATGCAMLLRADVLRRIGGFDASYFAYIEDVEMGVRIQRSGGTMWYEPSARVMHKIPMLQGEETPFQIRQRDRNRRRLAARHYGVVDRVRFAAWFYPTRLMHWVGYASTGRWGQASAILIGMFGPLTADPTAPTDIATRVRR